MKIIFTFSFFHVYFYLIIILLLWKLIITWPSVKGGRGKEKTIVSRQ